MHATLLLFEFNNDGMLKKERAGARARERERERETLSLSLSLILSLSQVTSGES